MEATGWIGRPCTGKGKSLLVEAVEGQLNATTVSEPYRPRKRLCEGLALDALIGDPRSTRVKANPQNQSFETSREVT
jgi:hypothetical protein